MPRLVIDTYNVIMRDAGMGPAGVVEDAAHLARLIGASRFAGCPATLVCDGAPPAGHAESATPSGVVLRFSGPDSDADSLIEQMIRADTAPRSLLVVSSDRRIRKAARRRRCRSMESDAFLTRIIRDATSSDRPSTRGPSAPAPADAEAWIEDFGLSDSWLGIPASPEPAPRRTKPSSKKPTDKSTPGQHTHAPAPEPWVREALEHFGARLRVEDLDMQRWLGEHPGESGARRRDRS